MLRITFDRARQLVSPQRIFVIARAEYRYLVEDQLPELPPDNILDEPADRDTAAAIGYAAIRFRDRFSNAVMVVLASDHYISPVETFCHTVRNAVEIARCSPYLVSLGTAPTEPNIHYGYMLCKAQASFGMGAFWAENYIEKPTLDCATLLLQSGTALWNINVFAWQIATLLEAFRLYHPDLYSALMELGNNPPTSYAGVSEVYASLEHISIDYAVLEKVRENDKVSHVFLNCDCSWCDVGTVLGLASTIAPDMRRNRCRGAVSVDDCSDCILLAESPFYIRARGLSHMVVMVSQEGDVLIAPVSELGRAFQLVQCSLCATNVPPRQHWLVGSEDVILEGNILGTIAVVDAPEMRVVGLRSGFIVTGAQSEGGLPVEEEDGCSTVAGRRPTKVFVTRSYEALSDLGARIVTESLRRILCSKGKAVVAFSAGGTPERLYEILTTRYLDALDWSRVILFQMDEYVGLAEDSRHRYSRYLLERIVNPLGITRSYLLRGDPRLEGTHIEALEEQLLREGGLDFCLHGIGTNGHIGFNEPGSSFRSSGRIVELTQATREANRRFFGDGEETPRAAATLGLAILGAARMSILLASGVAKHAAIRRAILGPLTEDLPATCLRCSPELMYVVDEKAWLGK